MGFLTNLVSGVMDNVIENKVAQNKKKLENDPVLKKMEAKLAKDIQDFEDYLAKDADMTQDEFLEMLNKS